MSSTKQSSTRHSTPDIVTFRLGKDMVYVPPANDYQEAIKYAKSEFPEQLKGVDPRQLSFTVNSIVRHETRSVRISPMSWKMVMSTLSRYEIIDVVVQPEIEVLIEAPPGYAADEHHETDEKDLKLLQSGSPSHNPRSRSGSSSREPSPDIAEKGKSPKKWIEKLLP